MFIDESSLLNIEYTQLYRLFIVPLFISIASIYQYIFFTKRLRCVVAIVVLEFIVGLLACFDFFKLFTLTLRLD